VVSIPIIKHRLSHLILGQKGGQNRIQIIELLRERPYNLNQLAEILELNYRTIKHHIDVLLKNELVSTSRTGGYGEVYFLTPEMEGNLELFEDINKKFNISKKLKDFTSSPKFFQKVMEQTNDAVIIINTEGQVFFWNKSAEAMFGCKKEEVLGDEAQIFHDTETQTKLLGKAEKGKKVIDIETVGMCRPDNKIDISVTVDAVKDENKNIIGYSIMARDISERKKAEQRINYLNSLLKATKDISKLISHETKLKALAKKSCTILEKTRGYMDISISFMDDKKGMIVPIAHSGRHKRSPWEVALDGKGKAPKCVKSLVKLKTRKTYTSTVQSCKGCRFCKHGEDHQSILIPMMHEESLVGIMVVCLEPKHEIEDEEVELLDEIAEDLAFARDKIIA
jgi:PAS domain S-box-containing protein